MDVKGLREDKKKPPVKTIKLLADVAPRGAAAGTEAGTSRLYRPPGAAAGRSHDLTLDGGSPAAAGQDGNAGRPTRRLRRSAIRGRRRSSGAAGADAPAGPARVAGLDPGRAARTRAGLCFARSAHTRGAAAGGCEKCADGEEKYGDALRQIRKHGPSLQTSPDMEGWNLAAIVFAVNRCRVNKKLALRRVFSIDYFAYSITRCSRISVTRTSPGNFISLVILSAISRANFVA